MGRIICGIEAATAHDAEPVRIAFRATTLQLGDDITQTPKEGGHRQRIAHLTEKLTFLSQDDKDWVIDVAELIMPLISRGEWARLNLVELGSAPEIDRR